MLWTNYGLLLKHTDTSFIEHFSKEKLEESNPNTVGTRCEDTQNIPMTLKIEKLPKQPQIQQKQQQEKPGMEDENW